MIRRAFVAFLLLIPLSSLSSQACTCSNEPPGQCPGLQKDDVVFLGTVTVVEDIAYAAQPPPDSAGATPNTSAKDGAPVDIVAARLTHYRFHVDESFATPDAPQFAAELDVFSGGDDGDCGYRFRRASSMWSSRTRARRIGCSRRSAAARDRRAKRRRCLPQLRAMRTGQRVASVFGVLRRSEPPFLSLPDDPDEPLPNVSLKLRSRDDRFETSSNSRRRLHFLRRARG